MGIDYFRYRNADSDFDGSEADSLFAGDGKWLVIITP